MNRVPYDANFYKQHPLTCAPDDLWGQVRRTVNGKPVSEDQIQMIVAAILRGLSLRPEDVLLDLCCGNGALTDRILAHCSSGLGVDFSDPLIKVAQARFEDIPRAAYLLSDVVEWTQANTDSDRFSVALCYGSFCYLTEEQATTLLRALRVNFPSIRSLFLGNLPDREQMAHLIGGRSWTDGDEYRHDTQFGVMRTTTEMKTLCEKAGWTAEVRKMPNTFFAAQARYDVVLTPRESSHV